jgi:hypothetical protein
MSTGLAAFTLSHVVLSLVGILSGLVVVGGFLTTQQRNGWTALFLASMVLTSVTGFLFPFHKFLPSHATGIVSLLVLAVTIPALYFFHLVGPWRRWYRRHRGPLCQRFCFDRSAFREDPRAQISGAHAIRTSVPWRSPVQALPSGSHPDSLSAHHFEGFIYPP